MDYVIHAFTRRSGAASHSSALSLSCKIFKAAVPASPVHPVASRRASAQADFDTHCAGEKVMGVLEVPPLPSETSFHPAFYW